jgi:PKD repeat protein
MKKNLTLLITLGGIFLHSTVLAQDNFGCGLQHKLVELYESYPGLESDQAELLERSKHYTASGDREEVYTIPVVFHIIHENGVENISDAQIYDQMEILNRDFRKLNADTTDIMSEFIGISSDTKIEFKLANIDPYGNCTNGIEHIYSHETRIGDDNSKLNQWPRSRYLNVWIVKSMEAGTAGYAYYPSAVSTSLYYADGIIIRHEYIGRIGTGSETNSRALTHEIGHWLGLPHTWGSTNEPEVGCGDDGIEDTPETAGHASCVLVDTDNCNDGIAENVQNYMEYSYCSRMFTNDQSAVMNLTLNTPISGRQNLHSDANKVNSGIITEPVLCTPLPNFYSNVDVVCPGEPIQFFSTISRAEVTDYSWTFPGGTPSTSTEMSPTVIYEAPGIYDVILTVSNTAGAETETKLQFAHVLGDYWFHEGPYYENFENENFKTSDWYVFNPEENDVKWKLIENAGKSGNQCIGLEYYIPDPDPILLLNYYERQGGTQDMAVTPSFNLDNTTGASINFSYIFATNSAGIFESEGLKLRLYYLTACSDTWVLFENLDENDLVCSGFVGEAFYPESTDSWQDVSVNVPLSAYSTNTRFKIEFTAFDYINNFFIDDFNIGGVLSDGTNSKGIKNVSVYPNPSIEDQAITLSFNSDLSELVDLQLFNLVGDLVYSSSVNSLQGANYVQLDLSNNLSNGVYNLLIKSENSIVSYRVVIN